MVLLKGPVEAQDEGVRLADVDTLNFAGAGVSAAVSGKTATVTIPGGGTGFSLVYFGAGTDGAVTISGNTTLSQHLNCSSLTVDNTFVLTTGGWAIHCSGTVTNNGTIRVGPPAKAGNGAAGGTAGLGVGLTGGELKNPASSNNGGAGGTGVGGNSNATSGFNQVSRGAGGRGGSGGATGSAGGTAGLVVAAPLILSLALDSVQQWLYVNGLTFVGANGGTGGGGGAGDGVAGGGGGAAGCGGGICVIIANTITNNGTIAADGGAAGDGGSPAAGNRGGGGGGGGGEGGVLWLVYKTITVGTLSVAGGAKGLGAAGIGTGGNGIDGSNGNAGTIVRINLTADTVVVT